MRITVFSTNTCGYCSMVKKYLSFKHLDFTEVNLDDVPEKRQEVFDLSGASTVPVTLIERDDGRRIVIGYNIPSLSQALA